MASSASSPQRPKAWCQGLLRQLVAQAGLIRDAAPVEELLATLVEQDPDAETFPILLERHARDPRPEVAEAARRIRRAWDRQRGAAGALPAERPRVLVVDDEPDVCNLLATALGRAFDVSTAGTGEAALAQARAQPPALVVLDIMMPGMDGYAVARELRAHPTTAGAKILFCTARGGVDARLLGREVGGDGYIVKPFDLDRLAAQSANLLGMDPLGI